MSVQTNDLFLILLHGYIGKGYEYEYIGETFWRGVFQKTSILTTFTLILYKELPKAARWRGWENSETLKLEMSWKNWHKFLYSSRIQNNTTLHLSIRYVNFIHFDLNGIKVVLPPFFSLTLKSNTFFLFLTVPPIFLR